MYILTFDPLYNVYIIYTEIKRTDTVMNCVLPSFRVEMIAFMVISSEG